MSLIEYAKRAAVRRVVYLVIAGLIAWAASYCGFARAQGAAFPNCYSASQDMQMCADMQHARAGVEQALAAAWTQMQQQNQTQYATKCIWTNYDNRNVSGGWSYYPNCGNGFTGLSMVNHVSRGAAAGCPAGTAYDAALTCKTLCDTGSFPDPGNPGQCLSDAQCTAKNVNQQGTGSRFFEEKCIQGCLLKWQPASGSSSKKEIWNANGTSAGIKQIFTGKFQYVRACSMDATPPDKKSTNVEDAQPSPNECVQAGTQTACIKPTGEMCAKASTGREFCWKPHQTGEKTDKNVLQTKTPGEGTTPGTIALANGDTATKSKDDIIVKETKGGQTSTTQISTYTTASGANAGSSNMGSNAASGTGAGAGPNGGDEGEDDDNKASGGADCDAKPIVSGDEALAMVADQAWYTRCAVEAGNAAKVTGNVDDCTQPFTVEGSNANAVKLRAMREQICGQPYWTKGGKTDTPGTGEGPTSGQGKRFGLAFGTERLDREPLFGGGQCPSFSITVMGRTVSSSELPQWCTIVSIMRVAVLIVGAFTAIGILTGRLI